MRWERRRKMAIEVNGISKTYTGKKAVDNVSFTAEAGKALGLLGRNGAGKTTTIRVLMNVIRPESGSVTLDGKPINYDKVRIGYLPEERGLYAKKEIFSQLVYFARLKGMERADAAKSVDGWLERVGLAEYRNKKLETLSKGNQQKVQLITALAHDPQIIILDEPFSGLDPVNAMMLEEIVKEQIEKGKMICTQFPGHIDLCSRLNPWMPTCILRVASILFLPGCAHCCSSQCTSPWLWRTPHMICILSRIHKTFRSSVVRRRSP